MVSRPFTNHTNPTLKVGLADQAVTSDNTVLKTSGLGSCVAIVLHDPESMVSGLLHAMLPSNADVTATHPVMDNPSKYVDTGVDVMITEMQSLGASVHNIKAWVVGGSEMIQFSSNKPSIGERNIVASTEILTEYSITLVNNDVGGGSGRSVAFYPEQGVVTVKSGTETRRI